MWRLRFSQTMRITPVEVDTFRPTRWVLVLISVETIADAVIIRSTRRSLR